MLKRVKNVSGLKAALNGLNPACKINLNFNDQGFYLN